MVYHPKYDLDLGAHVFPATKFSKIMERIEKDGSFSKFQVHHPEKAEVSDLRLVHTEEYLKNLFELNRNHSTSYSELPLTSEIVNSFVLACGGTILATELTQTHKFVFHVGGGFHHSFPEHAEGFCYLNDAAIGTRYFQRKFPQKKVLLIDLDLHQGNGNSYIFEGDHTVFTFSMHQGNLYPKKENSTLDISLDEGCGDAIYLKQLEKGLKKIGSTFKPDLIYYLAGADPYENDTLGSLNITISGLIQRDALVKKFAEKVKCPVVVLLAGGYAKDFSDTIQIHLNTAGVFADIIQSV
ncbi:MAG: histone deacetylase [Leptospiraceae bacterium]|nr:histone deacetylase [Leptospiraceae bacterium]MCK6380680.1 histone deacetylase [Leptospiraceae bacterium]